MTLFVGDSFPKTFEIVVEGTISSPSGYWVFRFADSTRDKISADSVQIIDGVAVVNFEMPASFLTEARMGPLEYEVVVCDNDGNPVYRSFPTVRDTLERPIMTKQELQT